MLSVRDLPGSCQDAARDRADRALAEIQAREALAAAAERSGSPRGEDRSGEAAAAAREARPPWHYAKHVSARLSPRAPLRIRRRHYRSAAREILWRESKLERVRKCGRVTITQDGYVLLRARDGVAHYAGLATCGSIWACPMCGAKIRAVRADEISAATAAWDRAGNSVYMVTFTAPHDLGMALGDLLKLIAGSFRAVISGRPWRRLRKALGIVGTIRAVEVTHGWVYGWHPHLHVLVYVEGDPGAEGLAQLTAHMREKWRKVITGAGYRPPHDTHGVTVQRCLSAAEAGAYIAKTQDGRSAGNEIARGDLKQGRDGNRTPFEILESFRWTGDAADLALWHEYETATKGHQCISWSAGLREILGATAERTDEEVAAEEVGGDDIALIEPGSWAEITTVPGLATVLLEEAEAGGLVAVNAILGRHGIPLALQPRRRADEQAQQQGSEGPAP